MNVLLEILDDDLPESFNDLLDNDLIIDVYGVIGKEDQLDANIITEMDQLIEIKSDERSLRLRDIVIQLNEKIERIKITKTSQEDEPEEDVYI